MAEQIKSIRESVFPARRRPGRQESFAEWFPEGREANADDSALSVPYLSPLTSLEDLIVLAQTVKSIPRLLRTKNPYPQNPYEDVAEKPTREDDGQYVFDFMIFHPPSGKLLSREV